MKGHIKLQTATFMDNSQAYCYEVIYVGRQ